MKTLTEKTTDQNDLAEAYRQHIKQIRELPEGTLIYFTDKSAGKYFHTCGFKTRTLRRNSPRVEVQTMDGKLWRWPMGELFPIEKPTSEWIPINESKTKFVLNTNAVVKHGFDASYIVLQYSDELREENI